MTSRQKKTLIVLAATLITGLLAWQTAINMHFIGAISRGDTTRVQHALTRTNPNMRWLRYSHAENKWALRTPLEVAATNSTHIEILELLLESGAHPNRPNTRGGTPLHAAATHATSEHIRLLLRAGANPHTPAKRHGVTTPLLHLAVQANRPPDVITTLLELGLDINERDGAGNTPLHHATQLNTAALLSTLLNAGADPTPTNATGATPHDLAQTNTRLHRSPILQRLQPPTTSTD